MIISILTLVAQVILFFLVYPFAVIVAVYANVFLSDGFEYLKRISL